jgi:hypothetical protein
MGIMAKMASMQGLSPGIAVVTQKAAEMVYVIFSIVGSCVLASHACRTRLTKSTLPSPANRPSSLELASALSAPHRASD